MGKSGRTIAGLAFLLLLTGAGCTRTASVMQNYTWLLTPEYRSVGLDEDSGGVFSEGLLPVSVLREDASFPSYGYVDTDGRFAISPQFSAARPFSGGLAAVSPDESGLFGFIDLSGRYVIPVMFGGAGDFSAEGLAPVCDAESGLWGYIDWTGTWVVEPAYSTAGSFHDGAALVGIPADGGEVYNYIDTEGHLLCADPFVMAYDFSEGFARVWVGDDPETAKAGFIDASGRMAIEPRFYDVGNFSDGLAYASSSDGGLYGYIDATGEFVIPSRYVFASDFSGGLAEAGVYADGSASETAGGYIDRQGKWVISPQYYLTRPFKNGYAVVIGLDAFKSGNGTHTIINRKGNEVLPMDRELPDGVTVTGDLYADLAIAKKGGLFGIVRLQPA